jgi:hypothetical protein
VTPAEQIAYLRNQFHNDKVILAVCDLAERALLDGAQRGSVVEFLKWGGYDETIDGILRRLLGDSPSGPPPAAKE